MKKVAKKIGALLPKNHLARGVSVLVGGTAGAQLLLLLAAPVLTRLYSPEDFGLVAVYASALALIGVVSSLRYELAIPIAENDVESANVAMLSLLLVMLTTLLTALLVSFFGDNVAIFLGYPALGRYIWLLPVGVLLGGLYSVFSYWALRAKHFAAIAGTKFYQVISTLLIQLGAFKFGAVALLFGQIAGQGAGTINLAKKALASASFRKVTLRGVKDSAVRYWRFPIFSSWEALLNTASLQLPPLMFAAMFSPSAAGIYSLANRVMNVPTSIVGSAIGQVFFANAAEAQREGRLGSVFTLLHGKLTYIGLPPAVLLMLTGPELFRFVFGSRWGEAGELARWMTPWLYLVFVASPLTTLFAVLERNAQGLSFQAILLASRMAAIGLGALTGDFGLTVMLFSGVSAACWVGLLFWMNSLVGNDPISVIRQTISSLGISLICAAPVLIAMQSDRLGPKSWLFAVIISGLLIGAHYWRLIRRSY